MFRRSLGRRTALFALLGSVPLALLAGCMQQRAPRNQVQPNAIQKTAFSGDWYFLQTVVDVPYTTAFTFIGEQSQLEKIRWEIQEDFLVAYRTYEQILGTDLVNPGDLNPGAPVAAYMIHKHFDIRRAYNSTTGEELNVIEENDRDRPWYEREFMRVDWSRNQVTNWQFLADHVDLDPVAYYVQDQCGGDPNCTRDPDAPIVQDGYFEITNKFMAQPGTIDYYGDTYPACWFFYRFDDCVSQEIKVRNSFLRLDPTNDYERQLWSDRDQDLFGFFDAQRIGYDPHYGPVESLRRRYAMRWNIWQVSHANDTCTTTAECGVVGVGSRCDLDYGRCTLPYLARTVRPVVYHVSRGYPTDLLVQTRQIAAEWGDALRATINGLREVECLHAGGASCALERDRPDVATPFILCENNPVQQGDPAECGPLGTSARMGDLRYSFMSYVPNPQLGSPFGYGPSAMDPQTGQIIAANANVYGAVLETYSTWGRDIVRLLNGEIAEDQYIQGVNVRDWVAANHPTSAHPRELTQEEVDQMAANVNLAWTDGLPRSLAARTDSAPELNVGGVRVPDPRLMREGFARLRSSNILAADGDRALARLSALQGTPIEAQMTNGAMLLAAGLDPRTPLTGAVLEQASPLQRFSPQQMRFIEQKRTEMQNRACVYFADFADDGIIGYAREHAGQDPEMVRAQLRGDVYLGVMAHEVGHTMGLRHNFVASADAMNYEPEYWALRGRMPGDAARNVRYLDPETPAERDGKIREFQYSSVMDYGSRFNSDIHGLGHYDHAAVKFGYGRLAEIFPGVTGNPGQWVNYITVWTGFGFPMPLLLDGSGQLAAMRYTDLPNYVPDLEARQDVAFDDLQDTYGLAAGFGSTDTHLATLSGQPRVPYRFCSDEFAGASLSCQRFDAGADMYEIAEDLIDRYQNYYIFNNFKRDRVNFNPGGYLNRIMSRYLDPLVSLNQWYVLLTSDFIANYPASYNVPLFLTRPDGFGPLTVAVNDAFNTLARIVVTPDPGGYAVGSQPDGTAMLLPEPGIGGTSNVGIIDGRWLETTWDFDSGYYWYDKILRIGNFYDKQLALWLLSDPTTYFLGRDTASDLRRYQISFYTNFPDQMKQLFSGLLAEQYQLIAPRFNAGAVSYPDFANAGRTAGAGQPIEPQAGFSVQLYASIYGMALIPLSYDPSYIDSARIYVDGADEAISPTRATVFYSDLSSGKTYRAVSYLAGGVETGIGARQIQYANALAGRADARAQAALRAFVENLELSRSLTRYLGYTGF